MNKSIIIHTHTYGSGGIGDYLHDNRYKLNLKEFYIYCINKIKQINSNSKFIICTNEYSDNLYKIFINLIIKKNINIILFNLIPFIS